MMRDGTPISRASPALIKKFGFMPLAGSGAGLRQPVHAEDLAIGAPRAASSETAKNKVYALPGPDTITYREMTGRVFDGLGSRDGLFRCRLCCGELRSLLASPFLPNANVAMGDRMAKDMVFRRVARNPGFWLEPKGISPAIQKELILVIRLGRPALVRLFQLCPDWLGLKSFVTNMICSASLVFFFFI